ncbi:MULTISPECIES: acyl-CoA thioesterase [unclassified Kitasatospora]|uniref:acyl-CoA thioesterase n=1 Tax=unclassified Kitasatospora TaxID=2633591 RepID=UPI00381CC454
MPTQQDPGTPESAGPPRGRTEPVFVHFDDLDAMGFVHNSRYPVLLEHALTVFWAREGFTFTDGRYSRPDVFLAVAEFAISYRSPIRGIGEVGVHFWISRLTDSTAEYGFRVLSADGGTVHAEGRRVHVRIDRETLRPTSWTPEFHTVAKTLL